MPVNGETNEKLGVYKNVCCGTEVVFPAGITFPDCCNHRNLPTEWKPVVERKILHVSELFPKKNTPAQ